MCVAIILITATIIACYSNHAYITPNNQTSTRAPQATTWVWGKVCCDLDRVFLCFRGPHDCDKEAVCHDRTNNKQINKTNGGGESGTYFNAVNARRLELARMKEWNTTEEIYGNGGSKDGRGKAQRVPTGTTSVLRGSLYVTLYHAF